jgi:hypothetical protein
VTDLVIEIMDIRAGDTFEQTFVKDLVTPNISACRKIDNVLLIKVLFIS